MGKKIGIDLGTTYSCVSYVDDSGVLRIVDNLEGEQTTPSVVFFDPNGEAVVGSTARSEGAMNPECLCERVKNFMGNADFRFMANGTEYSAAAVSTLILKKLIADAESSIGEEIEGAVITCPAYFGEEARNATKLAGESVTLSNGNPLTVLSILDEPTAAAIAYADSRKEDMDKTVLIYDLGGGTFDCTLMKLKIKDGKKSIRVITTGGDHQLGGKDWDSKFADLVRSKFCSETGCDEEEMRSDVESVAWFSENIEKAKKTLTSREATALTPSFNGQKQKIEVTRQEFEDATSQELERTISLVNEMLNAKGMSVNDIDEIILVGGSTYMPQVSKKLEQEYGKPLAQYEPNKAVAMGAALVANAYTFDTDSDEGQAALPGGGLISGSLGVQKISDEIELEPIVTKSYGVRYYDQGNEKVLNLVLRDSAKPAHGDSQAFMALVFSSDPAPIDSVEILVLESDSLERTVDRDICNEIYVEEPIKLDAPVPGNNPVSLEMDIDNNGILTLKLKDLTSGRVYEMQPKRKSDDANKDGLAAAAAMSLR
ncbi:MAG: Hsp70 family protein [Candidatus Coproplasma sp.]